jgi:hypothetical protein
VVRGCSPGGFGRKSIATIVSDSERMNVQQFMFVRKLPLLVDVQQEVGELVLSATSCPTIIILENTLN